MSFETYSVTASDSGNRKEVDYDAMNNYVVETAGLQEPETLVGVVVGIVDLGTQVQPDAELVFKGTPEDEAEETKKNPNTYFKDGRDPQTGKPARLKCYPQKPQQSVAFAVDFPEIIIDKGQFFGNSNPQPLRMWLGGSFYLEGKGMVVARPTPLKVVNIDKEAAKPKWSFSPLHLCYKMSVGAKLIKPGDVFLPNSIDQLLGKALQFQVQIYMKEVKQKKYFTESIKFVSGLGRGQSAPDVDTTFMIQFNKQNDKEALKQLRNHVVNTIKQAQNYEGSKIQAQLEEGNPVEQSEPAEKPTPVVSKSVAKPVAAKSKAKPVVIDDDDMSDPF